MSAIKRKRRSRWRGQKRQLQRAVRRLNRRGPTNWRERIDVEILNMHSGTLCVLGQVFGSYGKGLDRLYPTGSLPPLVAIGVEAFGPFFPRQLWVEELTR